MKITKKAIVVIAIAIITVFTLTLIGVYRYNHPTHYLYNDHWIIGKNISEIEQRYGNYDIEGSLKKGYCVKPTTIDWWGDATWPQYYMIYFDENGKAYKVDIFVACVGG